MFIVIETFDKLFPIIITNDEGNMPLLFETHEEALIETEKFHSAIVVEI